MFSLGTHALISGSLFIFMILLAMFHLTPPPANPVDIDAFCGMFAGAGSTSAMADEERCKPDRPAIARGNDS